MTFFDRVNQLIGSKGLTFHRVETDCGFANATIKRWATQSPRLESVIKLANYLQVDINYLAYGDSEITKDDGTLLAADEVDLISMYRVLDDGSRETTMDFVTLMYEKATGVKASIYSTYTEEEKRPRGGLGENDESDAGIA